MAQTKTETEEQLSLHFSLSEKVIQTHHYLLSFNLHDLLSQNAKVLCILAPMT